MPPWHRDAAAGARRGVFVEACAGSGFAAVTWSAAAQLCPGARREPGLGSEAVSAERLLDSGH